jgi:hypothetical protein
VDVYPTRSHVWFGIVVSALFALLSAALIAGDRLHRWHDAWYAAGVAVFGWTLVQSARQLRAPLPELRIDDDGIEGTFGRVAWDDVTGASIRWRWLGRTVVRRVVLTLRPGTAPAATSRDWASRWVAGRAIDYGDRIELPLWARKRRVVDELRPHVPVDE